MQKASENEIRQSIWRQTEEGNWKLFFNLNEEGVEKIENESQIKAIFDNANKKGLSSPLQCN